MQNTETASLPPELDYITGFANAKTTYDVFRVLKDYCMQSGFIRFLAAKLPRTGDTKISDLAIITNLPPELISAYDAQGFLWNSPIFASIKKTSLPYIWQFEKVAAQFGEQKVRPMSDLFAQFDVNGGVYFKVCGPAGEQGMLGFAGSRDNPDKSEIMEMSFMANHAFNALCKLGTVKPEPGVTLTDREISCVYWTSCGKTSAEVGSLLSLSDNTVNNYMASAATKLNANNKAHTVAIALRLGLLDNMNHQHN